MIRYGYYPGYPTFVVKKGIKYFELVAEPVQRELLPDLFIKAWGYNGTTPGPTILVYPGDYVNFRVYNRLSEPTSVHWHGLDVPNVMDGVLDVEPSPKIDPGAYFDYHFKIINPPGTHMYHTHHNVPRQEMMGLEGGLIILDPDQRRDNVQRDYFIMLQEFAVPALPEFVVQPGVYDIDPYGHGGDFNFFTMNGRSFPFTTPLEVYYGERVRIRLGNAMEQVHGIINQSQGPVNFIRRGGHCHATVDKAVLVGSLAAEQGRNFMTALGGFNGLEVIARQALVVTGI